MKKTYKHEEFKFLAIILDLMRPVVSGDLKGQIRAETYKVSLEEPCYASKIDLLQNTLVDT